jgi:hypothetical protein
MGRKKIDILNEVMGVPLPINVWVELITQMSIYILEGVLESDDGDWFESDINDRRTNTTSIMVSTEREITNTLPLIKKYFGGGVELSTEELLNNEDFQKLPLWSPTVKVKINVVDDTVFNTVKVTNQYNASFGTDITDTKIKNIGHHKIFTNVSFHSEIYISAQDADDKRFNEVIKLLKPTIAHELTHALQSFNVRGKNKDPHFGKEGVLNAIANKHMGTISRLSKSWDDLTYLIYLHLITYLYFQNHL